MKSLHISWLGGAHWRRTIASLVLVLGLMAAALAQGVTNIVISQGDAWGGTENPYCYVYLSGIAPHDIDVALTSSDPAACSVPATVRIPGGYDNYYFYVSTSPVNANTDVTITATFGSSASTHLLVKANRPLDIQCSQTEMWGGTDNPWVYVWLMGLARPGGYDVALSSSNPAALSVPNTVHIPGGYDNNYFYVATHPVSQDTLVTITATINGGSKSTQVLVKANQPREVQCSQYEVWGGTDNPYVYVYLMGLAQPGGYDVALSSSNPAALSVPDTVHVPGGYDNNYFYVATHPVSQDTLVTITATINGGAKSAQVLVKANQPREVQCSQPEMWGGSEHPYVYVYLMGPAQPAGYDVALKSSDPAALSVPDTVNIPGGYDNGYFYVTTHPVSQDTLVTITATINGGSASTQVLVKPNRAELYLSEYTIVGGTGSPWFSCTLNAQAPAEGFVVALSNSDPAAVNFPASLGIGGWASNGWAYFSTNPVSRVHYVRLAATLNGGTSRQTLIVRPNYKTVSGSIHFQGLVAQDLGPNPVTFELRTPGTTNVVMTVDGTVYSDGTYTFAAPLDGKFDLALKTGSWLRKVVPIDTTSGDQYYADFDLVNGDIDGDNAVTVFDYNILSEYFDRTDGDDGWDQVGPNGFRPKDADLDRDGAITVFDYNILSESFDLYGDE